MSPCAGSWLKANYERFIMSWMPASNWGPGITETPVANHFGPESTHLTVVTGE